MIKSIILFYLLSFCYAHCYCNTEAKYQVHHLSPPRLPPPHHPNIDADIHRAHPPEPVSISGGPGGEVDVSPQSCPLPPGRAAQQGTVVRSAHLPPGRGTSNNSLVRSRVDGGGRNSGKWTRGDGCDWETRG